MSQTGGLLECGAERACVLLQVSICTRVLGYLDHGHAKSVDRQIGYSCIQTNLWISLPNKFVLK